MIFRACFCLTLIGLFAIAAFSQLAGNPENWCREGFFTQETKTFGVGFVKPKAGNRTYFYNDDPSKCPAASSCRSKSYLVKQDRVITSKTFGDHVCGWFTGSKGAVKVGWLKKADLEFPELLMDASEKIWTGEWQYASNTISFSPNKLNGYLNVQGNAFWKGMGDNIHIGELDGRFEPKDGVLEYSDGTGQYDCRARMQLTMQMFLIVADNGYCGGANVSFSGIYRKVASKPKKN
ncbi:MAG TPA: hypothetical protein PLP21_10000 [Pyrinomonadaceae bacterium]|nr:hypothetical protein [Pyrinomonadaceae bacterium]